MTAPTPWQERNLEELHQRLAWLLVAPSGTVEDFCSPLHRVIVTKNADEVSLFFAAPDDLGHNPRLSGIMSRIDVRDPLRLLAPYSQVIVLSLLWKPDPRRIYLAGFAGGRLPTVLHHAYPTLIIESTEIDPEMLGLAERFFGVSLDHRQIVTLEDARLYLERQPADILYDIMFLDAYRGTGEHPAHLCTREFFELCRSRLTPGGVVAANLMEADPELNDKLAGLNAVFRHVYTGPADGALIAFCSDMPLPTDPAIAVRVAEALSHGSPIERHLSQLIPHHENPLAIPLRDRDLPPHWRESAASGA